jgi:hypothetical protein
MRKIRLTRELLRNGKKRGEWAELEFAVRAVEQGFRLWRPWGESCGYDWVVEQTGGGFARVQVKSTMFREGRGYSCSLKNSRGVYRKNSFDFAAAYVIPVDAWYILPERRVRGMWSVGLYPSSAGAKYDEYKEAWYLLRGEKPADVLSLQSCAEDYADQPPEADELGNQFPIAEI